ncbi:DUF362 domain-containing protein [Seleniivibrio sp.]|uniref:DUF362 domain-containing protein n=1 Tax=Seleniivibrio sp. TaxID=2898801 RepID=UPI0025DDF8EF|nr:DUF362 domain-containing protein [Seleniivibrio sp.]MCD8554198.1 DUF362 domain-containing protein [Seleniivibrio sp.]
MRKLFTAQCGSYQDDSLKELIDIYFESEKDRLASASKILIKPNLLSATPPDRAVTTHPDFVRAVISSLKHFTKAELILGDSPGANFGKYEKVLDVTGIGRVAEEEGVGIVRVESYEPVQKDGFMFSSLADEVDIIINLPKLKTHSLTGLTLSVKNLFGLVPGTAKVGFHRKYPSDTELGAKIYQYFTLLGDKTLHIMDGIIAHEGDGPSRGTPIQLGIAAACSDAVGLDIAVTRMIGLKDSFCLTTAEALRTGYDASWLDVPETNVSLIKIPMSRKVRVPLFMKKFVAEQVYVKPVVLKEPCIKCMLCKKSCPVDAISVVDSYPFIDKNKCIECFCCHEVCESDAVGLQRSWLHKIMVRS